MHTIFVKPNNLQEGGYGYIIMSALYRLKLSKLMKEKKSRMRTKRLICMLLTICMLLSLMPAAAFAVEVDSEMPFTDVKESDWFYDAVQYVYDNGLMNGTGDDKFSPNLTITRGMIVTILHRLEGTPEAEGKAFADVPKGEYYSAAVAWASFAKIVEGYDTGLFAPNDAITREQMATILYRYVQYKGYSAAEAGDLSGFPDGGDVSSFALKAVKWAVGEKLIKGADGGMLMPAGTATRAQAATILMRFCEGVVPKTHTVTFDFNYDGKIAIVSALEGETIEEPAAPERADFTFGGWYTDADGKTAYDFNKAITEDVTLYAKWTANEPAPTPELPKTYTVSFDYNYDEMGVYKEVAVEEGKTVGEPEAPSRSMYIFLGWTADKNGGQSFDFSTPITSDITLYAQWRIYHIPTRPTTKTYTVTFESNGGSEVASQTVKKGGQVEEPEAPIKDNYIFEGWYTDSELTSQYDFSSAVRNNITLYAKWKSEAEDYYETHAELIKTIDAAESDEVLSEEAVKSFLMDRGFGEGSITYNYSIAGDFSDDTEVVEDSANIHPVYQTVYLSEGGDVWVIYIINGSIYANPLSFNLKANLNVLFLISETEHLTSYDDTTNKFFVTIPQESEIIVRTVDKINSASLNSLSIDKICEMSGTTISETANDYTSHNKAESKFNNELDVMPLSDNLYTVNSVSNRSRYSIDNPLILVSLGDSYSSGEGIEPFYGQEKPLDDRVKDQDWLAHRSMLSWPSLLRVPGIAGTMGNYMVPIKYTNDSYCKWYFAAASGAETKHFTDKLYKGYDKKTGLFSSLKGTEPVDPQKDAFTGIKGEVDYVTFTIGGNDVGFSDIIITCAMECAYLSSTLENKINGIWNNFNKTRESLRKFYRSVEAEAGTQAAIIVAGYPQLFDPSGKGAVINKYEAQLVNNNVTRFNWEIASIVSDCSDAGMNIYFVDVESKFSGHEAYSDDPWIKSIIIPSEDEDIKDTYFSSYSMHPNYFGAMAYADLVSAKIVEIEKQKSYHDISGLITIADADMDMTNNIPLEAACVSLKSVDYSDIKNAYTSSAGEYTLRDVPAGTYLITVSKEGYIPVTERLRITENDGEVIFNITIEAISEENGGSGYASGQIIDVGTGRPVSGMTLYIRHGIENTEGAVVNTIEMNDISTYTTPELGAGNYTVQIVDERSDISDEERYITAHFNIKVLGGMTIKNQNGYISNGLVSEELRVVLTWGSTPSDLDSHMVGPDGLGGRFHEYYKVRNNGSDTDLDVDDTSSYGPETITVYKEHDGTYVYAVHDYTNKGSSSSSALSNSGAQVKVYRGNQLLATYNVPTNQDGTLWTVFAYDSTTKKITMINDMSYESTAGNVLLAHAMPQYRETPEVAQSKNDYLEYISIMAEDILTATKQKI